jgi:gliding motility-associated-like protein
MRATENGEYTSLSTDPNFIGANSDNLIFDVEHNMNGQEFMVEMTDMCGNEFQEEFTLSINDAPELEEEGIRRYCEGEEEYIILEHDATDYVWDDGSVGAVYLPTQTGVYEVSFTDVGTGCRITQEIEVVIEDCEDLCEVVIPTAFSPDNNGVNDLYRVINACDDDMTYFEFRIYNRWGELVYFTDNPNEGWDGIYQGDKAPLAVYIYHVEYKKVNSDKIKSLKGNVTLIR